MYFFTDSCAMARHRTSRISQKHHKPKASYSDLKAPTRDRRSHKGQRLNMWRESDMRGALDEWKAGTQKSIRKLALSWNVPAATLFKRTKKISLSRNICLAETRC